MLIFFVANISVTSDVQGTIKLNESKTSDGGDDSCTRGHAKTTVRRLFFSDK